MNPFDNEETNTIKIVSKVEIWVGIEKGRKNTFISGLKFTEKDMKEHIKNLKKKHGCNGSLKKDDENPEIMTIQLQGDHIDNICTYFNEIGITDIIIKGD